MTSNEQIKLLERRLKREKNARKQAENLLETKSLELYKANNNLQALADSQEDKIKIRTKELKIARDKALSASEAKSNFLATMSHEIRTPMNGVVGMAQLLLDTELNAKQRRQLSVLLSSSESLLQIINDVLDLSKLDSGKLKSFNQDFDLYQLIDDILNSLALTSAQKKLQLLNIVDSDIPHQLIGDPSRLRQILINLLGNAIKFTDSGYVLLKLITLGNKSKKIESNEFNNKINIRFEIIDTGKGISKENLNKLFKPFSQLIDPKKGTELQEGTGLGLSISKKLTTIMGGKIGVISNEKKGTTFWVEIPFEENQSKNSNLTTNNSVAFYQPLEKIRPFIYEQLSTVFTTTKSVNNLQELIRYSQKKCNQELKKANNFIMLDSENLSKKEYEELIEHFESKQINTKQWIIIQSITETNLKLSQFCEKNNIKTIIKPLSQMKLFEVLKPITSENKNQGLVGTEERRYLGTRILLAEDNKVNQMVTKALLKKQGIEVTIANDGIEALEIYDNSFDLIMLDINMPRMGGLEALKKLRILMKKQNISIPVIALTANALEGAKEEYLSHGMDGYLTKPIEIKKLANELEKWLVKAD